MDNTAASGGLHEPRDAHGSWTGSIAWRYEAWSHGGEPTLYPDLEGVVREAKHLGFWVSLKTHGVLSSRRLHALWEAGLNRIVVSLHGLAKVHDSFTGVSKSFEKTMAIVEDALALGIQVEVSITVTAVNRNEIVPLIAALEH